ncbi:hypothetical protein C7B62_07800 [Pleurocapsa sp. CCALA 161]|uniref:hypothetical protein n=1 Tax=Pleurocapsa sp. CCALA 161 TaxID=2107688 RepID=UPI000D061A97|nr:hypothetical protein [Pleurocapsa sp. CCALA 161]PSB10824.1 hypothetical protein C7B62_07800 [Pleurocapsa sp. CCALA 161]
MLNLATKERSKQHRIGLEIILSGVALVLIVAILLKAVLDVDNNYDPGWYHIPFAGRIWGILPRSMFIGDEKWFEPRFDGFPLLAHFLQGFFWRITGRMQSTNLVSFLSVIGYLFFLKKFFRVPLYLSAIALFSIPLVLTHASTSFVDLLGNIGTSILVMMSYRFYQNQQLPTKSELFVAFLGAAIAVNTKTQLQPLVFVILIITGIRLCWLWRRHQVAVKQLIKIVTVALLASVIIFASPIKNTVLYGNPLYPIKIQIAGKVLNHKLSPEAYEEGNRQLNWLKSVLDINTPIAWTADQWSDEVERNRRGGFFGAYVLFNFLLLLGFFVRELIQNKSVPKSDRSQSAKLALLTAIAMSLPPLNFPQSHELRYFMYWMISLVSLNLSLIALPKNKLLAKWLQPKYMGLVYVIFLTIVLVKTQGFYVKPSLITEDQYVNSGVKQQFLSKILPDEKVCLISKHIGKNVKREPIVALKYVFAYSSYFHPEKNYDYSIQAALKPESCGDRKIIPLYFQK